KVKKQIRAFGTTTRELLALSQWLQGEGCTHVAMESTGVYWKPVYAVLEGTFELIVANAQHIKNVPGRKTDVKDAEWIADLLLHGLLRPSFVPPKPIRELRDLTRYRRKLVESRSAERNRLLKVLETANIKLASVASDAFGVSGMQMLTALAEGKATPAEMAELAKGRLREKIPQLEPALEGRMEEHHRYLLKLQLRRMRDLDQDLAEVAHAAQLEFQQVAMVLFHAPLQSRFQLWDLLPQPPFGQLRHLRGCGFSFRQRRQHLHPRDSAGVTRYAGQLDVGRLQHLQQPVALRAPTLYQLAPVAGQVAQFANGLGGYKARSQQSMQQQIGNPLRILHVGLAPGHVLDVLCIGHDQLERSFQNGVDRFPVHPGALHGHVRADRSQCT